MALEAGIQPGPRRSATLPAKLQRASPSKNEDAEADAETLFIHPAVKIYSFSASSGKRPGSSSGGWYSPDVAGTLPWASKSERVVAAGPLRIYRVKGSVYFLHSGDLIISLLPRSQCWCVDAESKFAMRIQQLIYRIELPYDTEEDRALVQDIKVALGKAIKYEKTPCPFKRGFTVDLPEEPDSPLPRGPKWSHIKNRRSNATSPWQPDASEDYLSVPTEFNSADVSDEDGSIVNDSASISRQRTPEPEVQERALETPTKSKEDKVQSAVAHIESVAALQEISKANTKTESSSSPQTSPIPSLHASSEEDDQSNNTTHVLPKSDVLEPSSPPLNSHPSPSSDEAEPPVTPIVNRRIRPNEEQKLEQAKSGEDLYTAVNVPETPPATTRDVLPPTEDDSPNVTWTEIISPSDFPKSEYISAENKIKPLEGLSTPPSSHIDPTVPLAQPVPKSAAISSPSPEEPPSLTGRDITQPEANPTSSVRSITPPPTHLVRPTQNSMETRDSTGLVSKTCAILLGPSSDLVAILLQIAAKISGRGAAGAYRFRINEGYGGYQAPTFKLGKRYKPPGRWHSDSEDDDDDDDDAEDEADSNERESKRHNEDWSDEDDFGVPLVTGTNALIGQSSSRNEGKAEKRSAREYEKQWDVD